MNESNLNLFDEFGELSEAKEICEDCLRQAIIELPNGFDPGECYKCNKPLQPVLKHFDDIIAEKLVWFSCPSYIEGNEEHDTGGYYTVQPDVDENTWW
ncbi:MULTISPECIES: hypothetical protein [Pontibacillus]|uniref:Uncharacterized protein n=1 Tax=Pontibacillus chungwhensis TaxID=265426 RepID=A0ABY8V0I8_9BACI|nr:MULTISPECIES: hypothetical protein [Pontibacillus]WIF99259.1 hypothetical protein QNI29_06255 [Pontibacillus chungwhensis]